MLRLRKFFLIAVILIFVCSAAGPASLHADARPIRAQTLLSQLANQNPDQLVKIIVQKSVTTRAPEQQAAALGGKVTRDLSIINAFAAEMSADAALDLSREPSVRWVSLDAPMVKSGGPDGPVNTSNLANAYIRAIKADKVWALGYQGSSVSVAVVDSGVLWGADLYTNMGQNRVIANVRFNDDYNPTYFDNYGHGTSVAGVVGGNGRNSSGMYIGVAPMVKIVNVKVSNDDGSATAARVVEGLQWVLENKDAYNIRVVNLSLNSAVEESYHTSPIDAACEILWFNGIVVVTAAGNNGSATLYPPANDPFVITVGAVDDKGTGTITDDTIASFSAYGTTPEGFKKPDLVAPGKNIVSLMGNGGGTLPTQHPANVVGNGYFRMSGTSMAAPMVSGAVALLLQDEPNLTPDQVKYRLKATATKEWTGYTSTKAGAGYLNVNAALAGTSTASSNTGVTVSSLLTTGDAPVNSSVAWNSVAWNSVAWNSVAWNSVAWNSVAWNSVAWNSDYWGN